MELPEPFLPGAISLLDQLDKKMMIVLRDGKTLVGYLRTIDQFANLVLHNTVERIHVDNYYGDISRGIFLVRGENVVLAGEIDEENRPNNLIQVSVPEIMEMQQAKFDKKREEDKAKLDAMKARGKLPLPKDPLDGLGSLRFAANRLVRQAMSGGDRGFHNVVFVLGPPGSGKGTQCSRIQANLGFVHLSAGDLLRAERMRTGSEFGELIETHIRNGSIVPVEITCKLLENAMLAAGDGVKGFLIDGFPRNQDNLDGWQREMADKVKVHFVLYISAPIEVCVKRCLFRDQGRSDDNEESIQKRIVTYNEQTYPIIKHYEHLNMVREINGEKSSDEVYSDVEKIFSKAGFRHSA